MIAAIMQPYFFPYIGYFQLMRAVDTFIFHDDAQYIKSGWVNRNRVLLNGAASWLTLPVSKDSFSLSINQRRYQLGEIDSIKRKLRATYAKAPMFDDAYPFICELLDYANSNVAAFNSNLLIGLARKLGITCSFMTSSTMNIHTDLKSEQKVINMCQQIGADQYINPIGGLSLYNDASFSKAGIQLLFHKANESSYAQFDSAPLQFLSIIDVLMFNTVEQVKAMLGDCRFILPDEKLAS